MLNKENYGILKAVKCRRDIIAKRMRTWNKAKYDRYIHEGRGQGEGVLYSPWIHIQDFPSRGTVSRILGSKTGRVHHFMSSNEKNYFYLLEWSDDVLDIREQYPLIDIAMAVNLAGKAGIRYPRDSVSGFPYVLTTDFMLTVPRGFKARTIKLSSELQNARVLEKLEIERRYWNSLDIDWRIVTEHEIPVKKVQNIEWLHTAELPADDIKYAVYFDDILNRIGSLCCQTDYPLHEIASWIDHAYGFSSGTGLQILRHLLWTKRLPCTLESEIQLYPYISRGSRELQHDYCFK